MLKNNEAWVAKVRLKLSNNWVFLPEWSASTLSRRAAWESFLLYARSTFLYNGQTGRYLKSRMRIVKVRMCEVKRKLKRRQGKKDK